METVYWGNQLSEEYGRYPISLYTMDFISETSRVALCWPLERKLVQGTSASASIPRPGMRFFWWNGSYHFPVGTTLYLLRLFLQVEYRGLIEIFHRITPVLRWTAKSTQPSDQTNNNIELKTNEPLVASDLCELSCVFWGCHSGWILFHIWSTWKVFSLSESQGVAAEKRC